MNSRLMAVSACVLVGGLMISSAAEKGTIKVVSQSPLSGGQSVLGDAVKNGAQLAMDDFGKLITSWGFKLSFEPLDDQAKPDIGTANANRVINDADVLGVVGHFNSGVSVPASEVYAKVGLVMISPTNTGTKVTDRGLPNVNRVCGRDDVAGPAIAQFAIKTLKAKRMFVLSDKTAYGDGISAEVSKTLKAAGVEISFETGIDASETDFSSVLNRAVVDKPDAVFFGAIYDQAAVLLKQMRQKGITAPLLGGDGYDGSDLQKIAGPDLIKNVYFATMGAPLSALPSAKRFAERYKAKFGKSPEGYSAYAYDAARAVLQGISSAIRAGGGAKPSREAVAKAVRAVSFMGLTGKIAFNERGDLPVAKYFIIAAQPEYNNNKVFNTIIVNAPTPK
jgi:branched-chain amino acid transport system substrate-binding protein